MIFVFVQGSSMVVSRATSAMKWYVCRGQLGEVSGASVGGD